MGQNISEKRVTKHILVRKISAGIIILILIMFGFKYCSTKNVLKSESLLDLLIAYRTELEHPGLTVKDAAANLQNAKNAYEFVRDHTAYSPYYGHRQTSKTTLRTRTGNSQDRAYLLADILKELGWDTQFRYTDRTDDLPQSGTFLKKQSPILKEIFRRISYNPDLDNPELLDMQATFKDEAKSIQNDVNATLDILKNYVSYTYIGNADNSPNIRRVYVVASKDGKEETIFDPTYPNTKIPENDNEYVDDPASGMQIELWMQDYQGVQQPLLKWNGQVNGYDTNLTFFPTQNTEQILTGPPDPTKVKVWTPVMQIEGEIINGRPFTVGGYTPGLSLEPPSSSILDLQPVYISKLTGISIQNVDASNYPYVEAQVNLEGQADGILLPQNLTLSDNGVQVPVTVGKLSPARSAVAIVSDVSGSMETIGAFETSQQAIIRLSDMLTPQTLVSLISFAFSPQTEVSLAPLGDGSKIREAANRLTSRGDTGIYNALNLAAREEAFLDGTIVLLTDGDDTIGGSLEQTLAALNAKNIKVIAIALGEQADIDLMNDIANGTGGIFLHIKKIDDLDDLYGMIGRELSRYTSIRYKAPDCSDPQIVCIVPELTESLDVDDNNIINSGNNVVPTTSDLEPILESEVDAVQHNITLSVKETTLTSQGHYTAPKTIARKTPKLYLVFNTDSHAGHSKYGTLHEIKKTSRRNLYNLNDPNIGWALTGRIDIFADHGLIAPNISTAAYISEWINNLRSQESISQEEKRDPWLRPSYNHVTTINGLRTLTAAGAKTEGRMGGGPNIYLHRAMFLPKQEAMYEVETFDVVDRWSRAYLAKDASEQQRLEIAMIAAEGRVIGGTNAISVLINSDETLVENRENGFLTELGYDTENVSALTNQEQPQWLWLVDSSPARIFNAYYKGDGLMAKGASSEALAKEFDKIDKMYELYAKAAGKAAGLNVYQGALMAQIAGLKREENKLWCFSTLMMGHISDAIGDDDALLNSQPNAAKAKSLQLCKMDYDPDNIDRAFAKRAVTEAVNTAKDWAKNEGKSQVKNFGESFVGSTAADSLSTGDKTYSYYSDVVNPGFHLAMGKASGVTD